MKDAVLRTDPEKCSHLVVLRCIQDQYIYGIGDKNSSYLGGRITILLSMSTEIKCIIVFLIKLYVLK